MSTVSAIRYEIGPWRESMPPIGVVWTVWKVRGKCGCGLEDIKEPVAFFVSKEDALEYLERRSLN